MSEADPGLEKEPSNGASTPAVVAELSPTALARICDFIDPETEKKTLLSFALSFKNAAQVALDALWYSMDSLGPLFDVLKASAGGAVSVDENDQKIFVGNPDKVAWERLYEYRKRVRRFTLYKDSSTLIPTITLFRLTQLCGVDPLSPNLHSLDVKHTRAWTLSKLFLFLSPSLKTVQIEEVTQDEMAFMVETFLSTLGETNPAMKGICIFGDVPQSVLRAVTRVKELEILELGIARWGPWVHQLGRLERLHSLTIENLIPRPVLPVTWPDPVVEADTKQVGSDQHEIPVKTEEPTNESAELQDPSKETVTSKEPAHTPSTSEDAKEARSRDQDEDSTSKETVQEEAPVEDLSTRSSNSDHSESTSSETTPFLPALKSIDIAGPPTALTELIQLLDCRSLQDVVIRPEANRPWKSLLHTLDGEKTPSYDGLNSLYGPESELVETPSWIRKFGATLQILASRATSAPLKGLSLSWNPDSQLAQAIAPIWKDQSPQLPAKYLEGLDSFTELQYLSMIHWSISPLEPFFEHVVPKLSRLRELHVSLSPNHPGLDLTSLHHIFACPELFRLQVPIEVVKPVPSCIEALPGPTGHRLQVLSTGNWPASDPLFPDVVTGIRYKRHLAVARYLDTLFPALQVLSGSGDWEYIVELMHMLQRTRAEERMRSLMLTHHGGE
ncbi:hypothetical protein CC1G_11269 [Coprinopsis cinerea okayama7|uniref:Uncharacterized protein n=1 Tax=Coprinopsis cinerea (strain Okayama-7 / 130 / ATCC MYA-4618 / FGSC 9003) TaxID=240176 RepID=A8PDL3_COPC7|nr:hypothetical protein CC1G_11269 [Coprinopsis cinerea okayama7\|eukprot:XP_001840621.1 hypothetical protein CC1G_11269 [Coprinopsis cinerea okayama7\